MVVQAMAGRLTADRLLALLKHPLAFSGGAWRGDHLRLTRELELKLRRDGPAFPEPGDLAAWAAARTEPEARPWADALGAVMAGLTAPAGGLALDVAVARHRSLAEQLARGTAPEGSGTLWDMEAGRDVLALVEGLQAEAALGLPVTPGEYLRLFETALAEEGRDQRETTAAHPLITILGPREARESGATRVILAGLNEGVWPRQTPPDPWMNRRMRQAAGLLLPERQIGLAAHDFQQAFAAPEVILTRARRDAEAETVPARWLNRLTNLLAGLPARQGPQALAAMIARGDDWRRLAEAAATPDKRHHADPALVRAPRPAPAPPLAARPRSLSLSRIRDLIRDPYAIYARQVLQLEKLDPLRAQPDVRDRGIALHKVMERFIAETPDGESPEAAGARLVVIARTVLADKIDFAADRIFTLARLERAAPGIVAREAARPGTPVALERKGSHDFAEPAFTLHGRLDRADVLGDGRIELIDYKTGAPPSVKQEAAFEKQLLMSAVLARHGAFQGLPPAEVARTRYLGLLDPARATETVLDDAAIARAEEDFHALIRAYLRPGQGFAARRAMFDANHASDYDQLARRGEWEDTDPALTIPVGGDDGTE
jgi:RecB family exonuclease